MAIFKHLLVLLLLVAQLGFSQVQRITILGSGGPVKITHGGAGAGRFPSYCADGSDYSYRASPGHGQSYNYLPTGDVNVRVHKTDGTSTIMPLSKLISGADPILKATTTENSKLEAFSEIVVSLNSSRTDIASVEIEQITQPLTLSTEKNDTQNLLTKTIVELYGRSLNQNDLWASSDVLVEAHKKLNRLSPMAPLSGLDANSSQRLRTLLTQPDFRTLPVDVQLGLLRSNDLTVNAAGVLSASSIRYVQMVKKFNEWGLWYYDFEESLYLFKAGQGLAEVPGITPAVRERIAQISEVQQAAANYSVSPETIYKLVSAKRISQNGGVITKESIPWLQASARLEKASVYSATSPNESLDFFIEDLKGFQTTNKLNPSGIPDAETLQYIDQLGELVSLARSYREGQEVPEVVGFNRGRYILKKNGVTYSLAPYSQPKWHVLESADIEESEQAFRDQLRANSAYTDEVSYASIGSRTGNQVKMFLGDQEKTVAWTDLNDITEIKKAFGEFIQAKANDKPIIISRDFLVKGKLGNTDETGRMTLNDGYVADRQWINHAELLKELRKEFPNQKFVIGSGTLADARKAFDQKITSAKEVMAVIAPNSFGLEYESVKKMRSSLNGASIKTLELDEDFSNVSYAAESNIILLSGHKNTNYELYLRKLAEHGLLEDKVVIVFSCNEKGTTNLNSQLIARGAARNIIFFPSRLNVSATNAVLKELAALIKALDGKNGMPVESLLKQAVDNAEKNPDNDALMEEIKIFRDFLYQTTFNLKTPTHFIYG